MSISIYDALSDCLWGHINATNAKQPAAIQENHTKALDIVREKRFTKVDMHKEVKQAEKDRYSALAKNDTNGVRCCELTAHFFTTLILRM